VQRVSTTDARPQAFVRGIGFLRIVEQCQPHWRPIKLMGASDDDGSDPVLVQWAHLLAEANRLQGVAILRHRRPVDGFGRSSRRLSYAIAHFTRSLVWVALDLLLLWHLTLVIGLPAGNAGALLGMFFATGAAASLLSAMLIARHARTLSTLLRLQRNAAFAAAAMLALQFCTSQLMVVMLAGLGFRITYAMQDVAQHTLGIMFPRTAAETLIYARIRVLSVASARLCVALAFLLIGGRHGIAAEHDVTAAVILLALAMAAGAAGMMCNGRDIVREAATPMPRSPDLNRLIVASIACAMLLPMLGRLLAFAPDQAAHHLPAQWLLLAFCTGYAVMPLAESWIGRGMTHDGGRYVVAALIPIAGLLLQHGNAPAAMIGGAILYGAASGLFGCWFWSRIALTARMRGAMEGSGGDPMTYGIVIGLLQASLAAGTLFVGPLIDGLRAGDSMVGLIAAAASTVGAFTLARCLGEVRSVRREAPVSTE